jgi:hypothetical protein
MLPDHVEHWGGGSINIHHWGAKKIWSLKPPRQYLPTIEKMQALNKHGNLRGYIGVCQSTLTHRDVWFDAVFLGCDNYQVVQEPGDIMVIAPYAIHNVQNLGTNCAASKNVMPSELLPQCAAYKVCEHSEGRGGKPMFDKMSSMIDTLYLKGQVGIKDFIHDSDPFKSYKLRLVDKLKNEGRNLDLAEVIGQIQRCDIVPEWFKRILPIEEEQDIAGEDRGAPEKLFVCPRCVYTTNHHNDLGKHIGRRHGDHVKVPPNTNQVVCPDCHKVLKCLRKHKAVCKKRKRED